MASSGKEEESAAEATPQLPARLGGENQSTMGLENDTKEEESAAANLGLPIPENQTQSEWLMKMMKRSLKLEDAEDRPDQLLDELSVDGIIRYIQSDKCKNIVTMAGAGISTSAGIPDFRSPGTGLYDNLQKYNLSSPQAIFDINFFKENPAPFFHLARELWPGIFKPTPCHYFLKLLADKGLLLRHYTQNIDTLERVAGIDEEKVIEAHGTFHSSHCIECKAKYSQEWIKEKIFAEKIPKCEAEDCDNLVKPDIIFFGEPLPYQFFKSTLSDMPECDLLIIMGTSLVVQPFAGLTNKVKETTPRLYINLEKAEGTSNPIMALLGMGHGFAFEEEDNYRDVFLQGTCDDGCMILAEKLGWADELKELIKTQHKIIDSQIKERKEELEMLKNKSDAADSGPENKL